MENSNHFLNQIIENINFGKFRIPNNQPDDSYFPEYLNQLLEEYLNYYIDNLDHIIPRKFSILDNIKKIIRAINETIELYYQGKLHRASEVFFNGYKKLESFLFPQYEEIGFAFYRARRMEEKSFLRRDLFHIPFQKRYSITTNRYSIPGFPSLYLGDSTYVCWEEFDRYNFNDLSFIKLVNSRKLTFFPIHRIQDCLSDIERIQEKNEIFPSLKLTALMSYIMTFPIILACTIRVQNKTADFKPEYIIPQLLLEQITKEETIDGIKFLSSKVDYSKIQGVPAYNYVFPPKSVVKDGFCAELLDCFQSTAPTSFGLEKLFSSESKYSFNENEYVGDLEIIEEKQTNYHSTSFGMLEYRLKNRSLKKITDANTRPYNIVR